MDHVRRNHLDGLTGALLYGESQLGRKTDSPVSYTHLKAGILLCIFCNTVFSQLMPVMEFLQETVHCFQHNAQLQAYVLYIIYEK